MSGLLDAQPFIQVHQPPPVMHRSDICRHRRRPGAGTDLNGRGTPRRGASIATVPAAAVYLDLWCGEACWLNDRATIKPARHRRGAAARGVAISVGVLLPITRLMSANHHYATIFRRVIASMAP